MRRARPGLRAALVVVASAAVLLPAGAGVASASSSATVEVAALVQSGDRLVVQHRQASSVTRGAAVARAWDAASGVVAAEVVRPVRALAVDPRLGEQWGMTMLGAAQAWRGGPAGSQVVAVLDTGVDGAHPDLAGVVLPGKDLVGTGDGRTDPNGHGTHIAGIVAALAGNGIGGAGLAQGAKVLPVRVLDATGSGNDADVAEGLLWAVEHGATVINLSLAGDRPSTVLTAALRFALDRGVVVVAGSGNSGEQGDPVLYPAATPGVLAVGAVDRQPARPSWSSSGSHLGLVAPGAAIVSTVPGGGYASWSGTSMAAPFVAAAAALLKHAEPGLTPADVRSRLLSTARDLGPAGHDPQHGAGLVDVVAALAVGRPAPPVAAPVEATAPVVSAPARTPVLTLRGSRSASAVTKGRPVTFSTRALSDGRPSAGVLVQLERRVGGGRWSLVRRGTSGGAGLLSFRFAQDRTAEYRFRSGTATSSGLRVVVR